MKLRGVVPDHLRCDNGPEFICRAIKSWVAQEKTVSTLYIDPGSPWENAYAESYHPWLRDEVLNRTEFATLAEARAVLSAWREEYNHERPHSALGYKPPAAFAAEWACRHHHSHGASRAEACSAALRSPRHDGEQQGDLQGDLLEVVAH
jgi:IS30 family transposase